MNSSFRYPFSEAGRVCGIELAYAINDWARGNIPVNEIATRLEKFSVPVKDVGENTKALLETFHRELRIAIEAMERIDEDGESDFDARRFAVAEAIREANQRIPYGRS